MKLETSRLQLRPLTLDQLQLLAQSRSLLEQHLGLSISQFELNADPSFMQEFQSAIDGFLIPSVKEHIGHFEWYTHWLLISKEENITVGGIGSFGEPNEDGVIMIGYFIDRKFEGKGYASEAVKAFSSWILRDKRVKTIIADTPEWHTGSQKVLQKNGFIQLSKVEEGIRWALTKDR